MSYRLVLHIAWDLFIDGDFVVGDTCMNGSSSLPIAVRVGLCGDSCIQALQVDGPDVGRTFLWEQRSFLSFFGIRDGVAYRKRQRKHGYSLPLRPSGIYQNSMFSV